MKNQRMPTNLLEMKLIENKILGIQYIFKLNLYFNKLSNLIRLCYLINFLVLLIMNKFNGLF